MPIVRLASCHHEELRRYRDYDPFAWLYSNHWGSDFHLQVIPALDRILLSALPRKARIVDLCCGDGRVLQKLLKRGFHIIGIDGSEQMLSFARQRCPKATLLLEDARRFSLPAEYDAVISTFDSLNHIMDPRDLDLVFHNVHACLKPGGAFVFDLNREEAYREYWARSMSAVAPKVVSISNGSYDGLDKIAHCDITLFRLDRGTWQRSDFRLSQRFHPRRSVQAALARAGFSTEIRDAVKDLGMLGEVGEGRDFYLARKS